MTYRGEGSIWKSKQRLRLEGLTRPIKVIASLLLSVAVALQNPYPPRVTLPTGWRVHYWGSPGHGTGAILGPKGEEIIFPAYGGTGAMAATTYEADPTSLFLETVIDGRRVEFAMRSDGFLAVSYPPQPQPNVPRGRAFDFWTHTRSTRQVAVALGIALTRLEVLQTLDRNKDELKNESAQFVQASENFPFNYLSLAPPFAYIAPARLGRSGIKSTKGIVVELGDAPLVHMKWEEMSKLLGREIRVGEDVSGHIWACVSAPGAKSVAFVSASPTAQALVLATVMALTHKG